MGIISCGAFDKTYLYYFLFFAITMILLTLTLYNFYDGLDFYTNKKYYNNILLTILVVNFGQIFCFIPELIINLCILDKKEDILKQINSLCIFKKQKSKLAIEYIFNDLSDKITTKDILFIFIASILIIISDYIKVFVQVQNWQYGDQLILNEEYNIVELLCIFLFAHFLYNMKYYKHQNYSVILLILSGILRYILKMYHYYGIYGALNLIIYFILQFIAASFESIVIIFSKGLMEYKFFSPYKVCYIFGIITTIITIILLVIFTFIRSEKENWFFALKYNEGYYLDNFYSIFDLGTKLLGLFLASIFYGLLKLLLNFTINKFTVCHTFLLLQNRETTCNIINELTTQKGIIFISLIAATHLLDFFISLVFLEIIELNFCGLDQNLKRRIKERADIETKKTLQNMRDINEGERTESIQSSFYNEDDNNND